MHRKIPVSQDEIQRLKLSKKKKAYVYGFFPVDKHDCACKDTVSEWKDKLKQMNDEQRQKELAKTKFLECPRDKTGMKRYKIVCNQCKKAQGYLWATDENMTDWCDFHYVQWHYGTNWYGCYTPHNSPIDGTLCIECTCGNDTRDFRLNRSLPKKIANKLEKKNKIGRKWGQLNSKFSLKLVN